MIRKLLIDPVIPKGSFVLTGEYKDKKSRKNLYLVEEGRKVVTDYEVDDYRIHTIHIADGQPVTIEYDDSIKSELAIVDFLKNHPLCSTEGYVNPNLVRSMFNIRLAHEKIELDLESMERNMENALKVLSMSFEDKYNLAFALGLNPKGMTHSELVINLVGANLTGLAIREHNTFNIFYNSMDSNKKAYVYANKAVALGIVTSSNGYFKVGGRTIGTSVKDVVDLCLSDKEFFNGFIVPEVNRNDEAPEESLNDFEVSAAIAAVIEERKEELAADPSMIPVEKKGRGRKPKESVTE